MTILTAPSSPCFPSPVKFRRASRLAIILCCACILFFFDISPVHADQLIFKNGRVLECTIISQTDKYFTISTGSGEMEIPRTQIAKIRRIKTPDGTVGKPGKEEPKGNILSAQNAPEKHALFAKDFLLLMEQRNTARDAQYMCNLHNTERNQLIRRSERSSAEIAKIKTRMGELSREISEIEMPEVKDEKDVDAYNEKAQKKQQLTDEVQLLLAQLLEQENKIAEKENRAGELDRKNDVLLPKIPAYYKQLNHFVLRYSSYTNKLDFVAMDSHTKTYFGKVNHCLENFRNERTIFKLNTWKQGDSTIAKAILNGSLTGTFIIDTGAGTVVIDETLAKKLGINIDALPKGKATLADGRIIETHVGTLSSVQIDGAEARNVQVSIISGKPFSGIDGLLGMSFLKHFQIELDGAAGKIRLVQFQPM